MRFTLTLYSVLQRRPLLIILVISPLFDHFLGYDVLDFAVFKSRLRDSGLVWFALECLVQFGMV